MYITHRVQGWTSDFWSCLWNESAWRAIFWYQKPNVEIQVELEQLECLHSEDTPRRPVITHTIDQFVLNPKSILLTSSYRIPSQKKVKAEKIWKICKNFYFRILL